MKPIRLIFFFALVSVIATAQSPSETCSIFSRLDAVHHSGGKVKLFQDTELFNLVNKHVVINEKTKGISGYRIQIFFDQERDAQHKALEIKSAFLTKYPDEKIYLDYLPPIFKLHVGDFRTKNEAIRFMKIIETDFSNAFIVKTKINLPEIENQQDK